MSQQPRLRRAASIRKKPAGFKPQYGITVAIRESDTGSTRYFVEREIDATAELMPRSVAAVIDMSKLLGKKDVVNATVVRRGVVGSIVAGDVSDAVLQDQLSPISKPSTRSGGLKKSSAKPVSRPVVSKPIAKTASKPAVKSSGRSGEGFLAAVSELDQAILKIHPDTSQKDVRSIRAQLLQQIAHGIKNEYQVALIRPTSSGSIDLQIIEIIDSDVDTD